MTASEWLAGVSDSAKLIRAARDFEELRRNSALGLTAPFNPDNVHSTRLDPTRAIDELMDAQASKRERMASAYEEIAQARATFEGMRSIGWMEHESADILEAYHVGLMRKTDIARALNMSDSTLKRRYEFGVNWLDANGVARAKSGMGMAESL